MRVDWERMLTDSRDLEPWEVVVLGVDIKCRQ